MPANTENNRAIKAELLCPLLNRQFRTADMEAFIKGVENSKSDSLDVCFMNDKVFESGSAIYRIHGHWVFWHGLLNKPLSWAWEEDIDALIADAVDPNDLNKNWECISVTGDHVNNEAWQERKELIKRFLERNETSI